MSWLHQLRLHLLPAAAVIAFAISLSWGIHRLNVQQEMLHSSEATGSWLATQLEIEHLKFIDALHRYSDGDASTDHDELLLRFEILWSRIGVIEEGAEGILLRKSEGVSDTTARLLQALRENEAAIDSLERGDSAAYRRIRAAVEPFYQPLHNITREALLNLRPRYVNQMIDESYAWVRASFAGVFISGALLVAMLILQIGRANAATRASAEAQTQLRDAVESISEGFALYDANDRLVLSNSRSRGFQAGIEDMLVPGTSFEEITRAAAERGLYGNDVSIDDAVEARMARHRDPSGPIEQQLKNGRWLLVNEQKTSDGGTVVVRTDVTPLKNAEHSIRTAEEKFRNLVEGSIEGIVIHRDFKILFANEAWARMHGYTLEEAYGLKSIIDVEVPHNRERLTGYKEARGRGEPAPTYYETESLRKDGSRIWVGVMVREIDWDGAPAVQLTTIDLTDHKTAEIELKAAEEKFRKAFHASPDMIVVTGAHDAIIHDVNQRGLDLLGYRREEIVGHPTYDVDLWVDRTDYDRFVDSLRENKRVQDFEMRIKPKSGRVLDMIVASEWIEIGGERRLLTVYRDITDRREAERAHQAAEERFEKAFHSSPDVIAITGSDDGRIYDINETGLSLFEFDRDDVIGRTVTDLNIWVDLSQRARLMTELRRNHSVRDFEAQFKSNNGHMYDVLISAEWLEIDGENRVLTVARDITERKRSEAALHESEERFFKAFQASPNMIAIVGRSDGRLYDINDNWLKILGYARSDIVGNVNFDNAYWADQTQRAEFYDLIAKKGVVRNFETRLYTLDGEIQDYEFAAEAIELDGEPYSIVVGDDISERKRIDLLKNEFISTVSHELRTPLTSINGSLELLTGGAAGNLTEKASQLIEIAKSNSNRLVRLINDILDVEKIEAGRMDFRLRPVELMPAVEAAVAANQPYGERHGVQFELTDGLPDAVVNVDVDRLDQVFANLLSNAAKFSPKGGVVEISVTRQNGMVRMAVSDNGPGIPYEFRDRIFDKFTQADTSNARRTPGSGLGLSIAKAIVEKMEGTISLQSEAGNGCTFFFDLPEWKGKVPNTGVAADSSQAATNSHR